MTNLQITELAKPSDMRSTSGPSGSGSTGSCQPCLVSDPELNRQRIRDLFIYFFLKKKL